MELAVRLHRGGQDEVETLRHLAVAFHELRAESAGRGGDGIGAKVIELPRRAVAD